MFCVIDIITTVVNIVYDIAPFLFMDSVIVQLVRERAQ